MAARRTSGKIINGASEGERADTSARERVLRISAELFAAKGYDATGIRDIEAAVGLKRGALYYYIGSKERLLAEITMSSLTRLLDNSRAVMERADPADAKLRSLAKVLFDHFVTEGARGVVALTDVRSLPSDIAAPILAERAEYESFWTSVLDQGVDERRWSPVSPVMRRGIIGMFRSVRLWLRADGPERPEAIADTYTDFIIKGLS
jgi:AcrR family transcriptional regulator